MSISFTRRNALLGMIAAPLCFAVPKAMASNQDTVAIGLNARIRNRGQYFGSAVRADQLAIHSALRDAIVANCGSVTPEVDLKWAALEWNKGEFNFGPIDDLLSFTEANGIQVHGHTLLWEHSVPPWALAELKAGEGNWAPITGYLNAVLSRYGQKIHQWDVINEPIDSSNADGLKRNVFYKAFGPSYISRAFDEAHARAPGAKLLLNEYSLEYDNDVDTARRTALVTLIKRLKKEGAPVHGIGLQSHLDLTKGHVNKYTIQRFLDELTDLGLEIYISELDVQESDMSLPIGTRDRIVSDELERYLEIVMNNSNVRGITTWGLSDRFSWLNSSEFKKMDIKGSKTSENRGLPFDSMMTPKESYFSMRRTFETPRLG